jgi:putative toxin-antitoxin system antitoxin component (TIGR02293 family)
MVREQVMAKREIGVTSSRQAKAARALPAKRAIPAQSVPEGKIKMVRLPFDVMDFRKAYRSSSADRIRVIKAGVSARSVYDLATALNVSQDVVIKYLGLSKSTISRKVQADDTLSTDQSERVLGMSKLIGLVQTVIDESGDPDLAKDFDAAQWLEEWLSQPNPALGGMLPSAYLDTHEGQEVLAALIGQMQSGAYA